MRFAIIYKHHFNRTRSMMLDASSKDSIKIDLNPEDYFVEQLVDFDERTVTPVVLTRNGLIEVPDGEFGEATPAEYFENMEVEA